MNYPTSVTSAMPTKSQVATMQSELVTATEMLHQAIDALSSRLAESVLRSEPELKLPETTINGPVSALVALALFLEGRVAQVRLAADRINSILNRLEI